MRQYRLAPSWPNELEHDLDRLLWMFVEQAEGAGRIIERQYVRHEPLELETTLSGQLHQRLLESSAIPPVGEARRNAADLRRHDLDTVVVELLAEPKLRSGALVEARGDDPRTVSGRADRLTKGLI
jgi:hypothetical protein